MNIKQRGLCGFHLFDLFRVDRVTRYSLKVKSGEIPAYIPPEEVKKGGPTKWKLLYKDNRNPYERVFKPRNRQ